ncbi:MAG: hypothetical protein GY952_07505 [Rhodobacteraceae bacterium]|nr:hypothetical protein [Paracoccaceae bacterium]
MAHVASAKIDGHCPFCQKLSTFSKVSSTNWNLQPASGNLPVLMAKEGFYELSITCARDSSHKIRYFYLLGKNKVEKVGQHPSLADIANDEAATYHSVLSKEDSSELHKAVGLAAHGVGIGSFVYLRRVFERLIYRRFSEFKEIEGWNEEEFLKSRMDDKVSQLKGHVPEFLYENRKIYSILSKGIHELSDEVCLRALEFLKLSIKIILEEDKKKREELELKQKAADAIKGFES